MKPFEHYERSRVAPISRGLNPSYAAHDRLPQIFSTAAGGGLLVIGMFIQLPFSVFNLQHGHAELVDPRMIGGGE